MLAFTDAGLTRLPMKTFAVLKSLLELLVVKAWSTIIMGLMGFGCLDCAGRLMSCVLKSVKLKYVTHTAPTSSSASFRVTRKSEDMGSCAASLQRNSLILECVKCRTSSCSSSMISP